MTSPKPWQAWFDGATKHTNPGLRGIGGLLLGPNGQRIEISEAMDHGSNNTAEYLALIAVLDAAIAAGVQRLEVYGDSQLIVRQVNGEWAINHKDLVPLCRTAMELKQQIPKATLRWIRREDNEEADALSKKAIGVGAKAAPDPAVWMRITDIAKPFGLSAVALGKKLKLAGLRDEKGKPTPVAVEQGAALRVENDFGHDDYWHRQRVPELLRKALLLD